MKIITPRLQNPPLPHHLALESRQSGFLVRAALRTRNQINGITLTCRPSVMFSTYRATAAASLGATGDRGAALGAGVVHLESS